MKKLSILLMVIGLVFLSPLFGEDKDDEKKVDVKISVGAKVAGKDGSTVKAKEYDPVDDGVAPVLKAKIAGKSGNTAFGLYSAVKGSFKDQYHKFFVDFNRVLKQEFTFDSLYHRLDHDPLANIDVVSEARSAAYATDYNPGEEYHITRREFTGRTQLIVPKLSFVKIYVDYRDESRVGEYQARTLSKCSACHVTAKSRPINNYNRDIRIGSAVRVGKSNIDYSYTHNRFMEKEAAPTNHYLLVQHPETRGFVFTSRIITGNNEELPFDQIPESTKDTHLLKAAVPLSGGSTVTAQYLSSTVENIGADLKWKSSSLAGGFSTRFGRKGFFNVRFRQIKVDNDSVFIDVTEPLDIGGPNVGKTYAEVLGLATFDFTRYSALSRTVVDVDANLRYRVSKALRLQLGYAYKSIERENYDVESTKSSTFKAKVTFSPVKQVKLTLDGTLKSITDPFVNRWGGVAPAQQTFSVGTPFAGTQFYFWHADRRASLTNSPESVTELKGAFIWSPTSRFAFNANALSRKEKNDNLNYTGASWNREMFQWSAGIWAAVTDKFPISASYYSYNNKNDTLFAIAALEGCGAGIIAGMTGTLTDMMGYDTETRTLLINLNYLAGKKFSFFCNFNYNKSTAEIKDLVIDVEQLPYLPGSGGTALNFDDFGDIAEYSRLEMKQAAAELGFKYDLSKSWALTGAFYYYFYDDLAEYLYTDTSGKNYSFYAGFTWSN